MSFVDIPPNTVALKECPIWPTARDAVAPALKGKTNWTHSPQSPSTQPTGGVPLSPTPFPDAPDTAGPANANRTDAYTNMGNVATARYNTEATLLTSQIAAVAALVPAPTVTVTSLAPTSGALAGATAVTITGTGFPGGSAAVTVTIGGKSVAGVSTAATTVTFTTPAGTVAGPVGVTVTLASGAAGYKASAFTYNTAPSAVSSCVPAVGLAAGGTNVTIIGNGFAGATGVTFGGTAATNFVLVSDSYITCTTPAHAAGAVNVVVTDPAGNGTLTNGFTYQ